MGNKVRYPGEKNTGGSWGSSGGMEVQKYRKLNAGTKTTKEICW